jgi:hypothetical protein
MTEFVRYTHLFTRPYHRGVQQFAIPGKKLCRICHLLNQGRGVHLTPAMGKRSRTSNQGPLPEKPMPANSSTVTVDGKEYTAIKEGLATILFLKWALKKDKNGQKFEVNGEVFYNPIQQFNRDLSVLAIKSFAEIYFEEKQMKLEHKKANVLTAQAVYTRPTSDTDAKARCRLSGASTAAGMIGSVCRGVLIVAIITKARKFRG